MGRYVRMFPGLAPLVVDEGLLHALGRVGGSCDGSACPRGESRTVAAGWPVFGQYLAHDITADRSPLTHHDDEELIRNARSARLDLECLYGEGPIACPYLFSRIDPAKLLEGVGDLPRNQEGVALCADPRQDVHVLISQMHLGMIRAHNRLVDRLRADGVDEVGLHEAARRALTWHYQWVVVHDFLPATIGADRTDRLSSAGARGTRASGGTEPIRVPLEFADAAYRYGHSQIRERYQVRPDGPQLRLFPDLLGFRPVSPDRMVDWRLLLCCGDETHVQRSGRIDGTLPASLLRLPTELTGDLVESDHASLAVRDLLRGTATSLPSGEAVARELGESPLGHDELGLVAQGWGGETPLWFYVLKEAEVCEDGERLGPVGAFIVGETLIRIIDADPRSYRVVDPSWTPTLPARVPGRFTLADLLVPF